MILMSEIFFMNTFLQFRRIYGVLESKYTNHLLRHVKSIEVECDLNGL